MNIQTKIQSYSVHDRLRFKAKNSLYPLENDERQELERMVIELESENYLMVNFYNSIDANFFENIIKSKFSIMDDEDLVHMYCEKRDL